MRITLEIRRTLDLEVSRSRIHPFLHRVLVRIRFQQPRGWSEPHPAILDTGAPYSLIPSTVWPLLRLRRVCDSSVQGIVPGLDVRLETVFAGVTAQLLDARRASPPLKLWATLADSDRVPLILGWAGCLDRAKLVVNAPRHSAWLEF